VRPIRERLGVIESSGQEARIAYCSRASSSLSSRSSWAVGSRIAATTPRACWSRPSELRAPQHRGGLASRPVEADLVAEGRDVLEAIREAAREEAKARALGREAQRSLRRGPGPQTATGERGRRSGTGALRSRLPIERALAARCLWHPHRGRPRSRRCERRALSWAVRGVACPARSGARQPGGRRQVTQRCLRALRREGMPRTGPQPRSSGRAEQQVRIRRAASANGSRNVGLSWAR
jgi:hypothetical protein